MKLALSAQMRELDRRAIGEFGIASLKLMERAAEGIAQAALESLSVRPGKAQAAVFCGCGNNGGDGLCAARLLHERGVRVRVFLTGDREKLTADADEEYQLLADRGVVPEPFDAGSASQRSWARGSHVLIDALFGIGLSREIAPDSPHAAAISLINRCSGYVVSADVPSGVSADTGRVMGCAVRADRTVTFTDSKVGLATGEGVVCAGDVTVWDIGIPEELQASLICEAQTTEEAFVRASLPPRKPDGHKGNFGKLLVVGGSVSYTGAPALAASAAVRSGCGLVYLGIPSGIWAVEAIKCSSAMAVPLPGREDSLMLDRKAVPEILRRMEDCDVLALGPGLGRSKECTRLVCDLLREVQQPVVLDADGINAVSEHMDVLAERRNRVTILTPHEGEFARLCGDVRQGRVQSAREFARTWGCVLVLKGHRTVTASPAGNVLVNPTGSSALAKGGTGDVLTGLIASLLCQGSSPIQAAALGVWLHGRAGELAAENLTEYAVTPTDVIDHLPGAFWELVHGS